MNCTCCFCQAFKGEAYQLQIEMERLNHQAGLLLKKATDEGERCAIQEPMSELKMLWDNLDEKIISRQVRHGQNDEEVLFKSATKPTGERAGGARCLNTKCFHPPRCLMV